jgi:septum formation protein
MLDHLHPYHIILGSNSPRRQQLLGEIIPTFRVQVNPVEEIYPPHLVGKDIAEYLSELKSNSFEQLNEHDMVITADTIVCLHQEVLGKPRDKQEAIEMLTKLSNNTHTVFTGVTIKTLTKKITFSDATHVTFHPISQEEINFYLDTCQPYDKAGAYGIQEWLGYVKISRMEGEFYNVMGLPLHRLYAVLQAW